MSWKSANYIHKLLKESLVYLNNIINVTVALNSIKFIVLVEA